MVIHEEDHPSDIKALLRYQVAPAAWFKLGISSATADVLFGADFLLNKLLIEIENDFHPSLGFSPGLGIVFNFKSAKK